MGYKPNYYLSIDWSEMTKYIPMTPIKYSNYGFAADVFAAGEKMEDKTNKKFWAVLVSKPDGTLYASLNAGVRFDTEFAAIAEAEKCAKTVPGYTYTVVEAKTSSVVIKPAITTRLS